MAPCIDPCLSGKDAVPATSSPPLSGDVLRAYDNYSREVAEAAGEHSVRNMVSGYFRAVVASSLGSFGKTIRFHWIWTWQSCSHAIESYDPRSYPKEL